MDAAGTGSTGMHGGAGTDTFEFGAGTTYAHAGKGEDNFGFDAQAGSKSGAHFGQVWGFILGHDHIQANGGAAALANWGSNTGVLITTATGTHETIMLMGVTEAKLEATDWLLA